MNLSNKIEKYLPSEYKNLNSDEKSLLMDDIFKTESCSDCSYFRWGKHDENREYDYNYKEDKDGEIACCNLDGILSKLDFSPGADSLSAKEALRWWFGEGPGSLYLDRKCGGYDGGVPYLKKEIINYIEKRNALIERIIGFKGKDIFDEIPRHFIENLALTRAGKIDAKKLKFGNLKYIEMIMGKMPFSSELYLPV